MSSYVLCSPVIYVTCSCSIISAQLAVLSDERDAAASGGMAEGEAGRSMAMAGKKKGKNGVGTRKGKKARRKKELSPLDVLDDDNDGDGGSESTESSAGGPGGGERQREHPFVVTEPGEVARAKKNGLDYLFHLYEQCRVFLLQVQSIAKLGGHKSPTKVPHTYKYISRATFLHYISIYKSHFVYTDT